jgi:hypothetical protein
MNQFPARVTGKQRTALLELPNDGAWHTVRGGVQGLGAARQQLKQRGMIEQDGYGSFTWRLTGKGIAALSVLDAHGWPTCPTCGDPLTLLRPNLFCCDGCMQAGAI